VSATLNPSRERDNIDGLTVPDALHHLIQRASASSLLIWSAEKAAQNTPTYYPRIVGKINGAAIEASDPE
jgi:hypothetical protein